MAERKSQIRTQPPYHTKHQTQPNAAPKTLVSGALHGRIVLANSFILDFFFKQERGRKCNKATVERRGLKEWMMSLRLMDKRGGLGHVWRR